MEVDFSFLDDGRVLFFDKECLLPCVAFYDKLYYVCIENLLYCFADFSCKVIFLFSDFTAWHTEISKLGHFDYYECLLLLTRNLVLK